LSRIVVATGNAHKLEEYLSLLPGLELQSLTAFPPMDEVDENASTFEGNAVLKAVAAHKHTGCITLADDSGIEVEALNWRPGIRSARYAPGSDADRVTALLNEMEGKPQRRARFTCAIAVAGLEVSSARIQLDHSEIDEASYTWINGCLVVLGQVEGRLTEAPRGGNGFGYDPIFELASGHTTAEITAAEKRRLSHRGVASRQLLPLLSTLFSLTN